MLVSWSSRPSSSCRAWSRPSGRFFLVPSPLLSVLISLVEAWEPKKESGASLCDGKGAQVPNQAWREVVRALRQWL